MDNSIGTTGRRPSITDGLRLAPHAVYALVQTALVQDEALKRANARIEKLQAQTAGESQQQSGFLGILYPSLPFVVSTHLHSILGAW
jgi:hypothetical protein